MSIMFKNGVIPMWTETKFIKLQQLINVLLMYRLSQIEFEGLLLFLKLFKGLV